ncbi:MAG: BON domain-containing protein [Bryobacteraceae bacterium]
MKYRKYLLLGLAVGAGAGAGLMFMLDPSRGKRRRGLSLEKTGAVARAALRGVGRSVRDAEHRAYGLAVETKSKLRHERVIDDVLVARIRSKLGRLVSHPHEIDVSASAGVVKLAGRVHLREVVELLDGVAKIDGVSRIENHLDVHTGAGGNSGMKPPRPQAPTQP